MIQVVRARDRYYSDFGWLQTYWLFSFAEYYDPQNIEFGALRVFNEDVVQSGMGFPTHPHREMEIITIPLSGEITHADSMGNRAVIRAGDVQRMSAGTGLTHSEFNLADAPVHFYQIWIFPDERGLTPTYDQRSYDPGARRDRLCPVASGQGTEDVVTFHTDATIDRADLASGRNVVHRVGGRRRVFVYLASGAAQLNDVELDTHDQARVDELDEVCLTARTDAALVLIDVPSCKGFGYDMPTLRGARAR